jgi:SAM-dependent methyltransferase
MNELTPGVKPMSDTAADLPQNLVLKRKYYPESALDNFSHVDGTLMMFSFIASILKETDVVLEFGAGRGANISECKSDYVRHLQTLKGRCARVMGCDIDPVVTENPYLDEARIQQINGPIPYDDATFDLVVSSWVFEHVENAEQMASELLRVTKPGGYIIARTPNKYGYVALASRLFASDKHVRLLSKIQPERKSIDVFPTVYRMNTKKDLQRLFKDDAEIFISRISADPSYHFNNEWLYWFFKGFHKITPDQFATILNIFIRKRAS